MVFTTKTIRHNQSIKHIGADTTNTDYSLGLRAPTFQPLLGSGIFTQDGAAWRHSRQLLRPQFASNRVHHFEQVQRCVQHLIESIPNGGIVDLQRLFFKLTFHTTMFLLFGNSVNSSDWGQVADQESKFSQAFNVLQEYLSHRGRLGPFYWLLNDKAFGMRAEHVMSLWITPLLKC